MTTFSCTESNHAFSECDFSCPVGLRLDGDTSTITCQDLDGDGNGEWSDEIPDCLCN